VIVLAGAEHGARSPDPAHDGLLTAEEVRSLDLWGTQLVVLSACDSGKGAPSAGQGIYGLRRSFLAAGAETLVTSLWPIADKETVELMLSYYRRLVKERKSRVAAMEEAMLEMKDRRPHPYYWAPFIVIGQDGPLRHLALVKALQRR
jgi:CHAT domain-containing protein